MWPWEVTQPKTIIFSLGGFALEYTYTILHLCVQPSYYTSYLVSNT
jgi:hypothetical protein